MADIQKLSPIKQKLLDYLKNNPQSSVIKMTRGFEISKQAMHKHLSELISFNLIFKQGLPPKVFYSAVDSISSTKNVAEYVLGLSAGLVNLTNFTVISSSGVKSSGVSAFLNWCLERKFDYIKYLEIYQVTLKKYEIYYSDGLIDATNKVRGLFKEECYIDSCYYASFSAIEIFGKTGIYAQMLYAKQSGNRANMVEIFPEIKQKILKLILDKNIQAVGFIPPTVTRKVQLMTELENYLAISLPKVKITKIKYEYTVPQKTLTQPKDRIENAKNTFVVESVPSVDRILLIDDFVGSGSSFNYVAQKIKLKHGSNVICFAIAGTPNGVINQNVKQFEVINEA